MGLSGKGEISAFMSKNINHKQCSLSIDSLCCYYGDLSSFLIEMKRYLKPLQSCVHTISLIGRRIPRVLLLWWDAETACPELVSGSSDYEGFFLSYLDAYVILGREVFLFIAMIWVYGNCLVIVNVSFRRDISLKAFGIDMTWLLLGSNNWWPVVSYYSQP